MEPSADEQGTDSSVYQNAGAKLVRRAEFDHYVMRNAEPIPAEIRYLRLVLKAPVPNQSWSNQIAGIEIER